VLERSLQNNRLGHGILLHGESYSYLCEIAEAIAGYLLGCSKDRALNHPDCFTLRPSGRARLIKIGSESERRQGEWPQNSMRRLVNDLQKTANQGGLKVAIVYEADRMNHQSANAFLKTLEEPAAGSTLFLITCRPYDLLDTIRSRCLNFKIPTENAQQIHPDWITWTQQYRDWLGKLISGPQKGQAFAFNFCRLRTQPALSINHERTLRKEPARTELYSTGELKCRRKKRHRSWN
jgi:DNA polymerase-3 subunit delta'